MRIILIFVFAASFLLGYQTKTIFLDELNMDDAKVSLTTQTSVTFEPRDKKESWHSKKIQLMKSLTEFYQNQLFKIQGILSKNNELDNNVEIIKYNSERKPFKWG